MYMERNIFSFSSEALPETTFHVAFFSGIEGLNRLFDFHISLLYSDSALDPGRLLSAPCRFEVLREGGEPAIFSGYLDSVEQKGRYGDFIMCEVHLRPTFARLEHVVQSAIFLDKTVEEVLRELLYSQRFFYFPHEFKILQTDYPRQEFAMQYQESIYEYAAWRMEEQGIYFYFEERDGRDTVIFADDPHVHKTGEDLLLQYTPISGMEGDHFEEVIHSFSLQQQSQPRQVVIRSCSWHNPNAVILGKAAVDPAGLGDVYLTNEHVETSAQAERLARIRAQELQCRARIFHGAGSVPLLRPGRVFRLAGHYCEAFNKEYLVTEIRHEGRQDAYLRLKLGLPVQPGEEQLYYRNSFTCQEAERPFRPARTARRSSIPGVLHAFVAGGSGNTAYMDEFGRYKLYFPFDVSGRSAGNSSCWIRRALPQIGKNSGLALPLLPGSEVLVTFENGNPDMPVITGALANAETGSISHMGNAHMLGLSSAGGNAISINDTDTKQGISLHSAGGGTLGFQSGSLEVGYLNSASWVQIVDIAMTHLSGVASSVRSLSSVSMLTTTFGQQIVPLLSSLMQNMAQCFDTASEEKKNADLRYGSGVLKALGLGLATNFDTIRALWEQHSQNAAQKAGQKQQNIVYRATLFADPEKSGLEANIFQNKYVLLGTIVVSFLLKAASFGLQTANTVNTRKEMDEKQNDADEILKTYENFTYESDSDTDANLSKLYSDTAKHLKTAAEEDKKYAENAKVTSIFQPVTTGVSALLPEILALVLIGKKKYSEDDYYGILLDAQKSNINMVARDAISQHAARGHLRNTLDLEKLLEKTEASSNSAIGNGYLSQNGLAVTKSLKIFNNYGSSPINWGTRLDNVANHHATDFMPEDDTVFKESYWYKESKDNNNLVQEFKTDENLRKNVTFIADTTNLHTMRNDWGYLYSKYNAHIRGGHALEISAGDIAKEKERTGRILLQGPSIQSGNNPYGVTILSSNSGILLESRQENTHDIYTKIQPKADNVLSKILLKPGECLICSESGTPEKKGHSISGNNEELTLEVLSQGKAATTIKLSDKSIELSCGNASISITDGNINVQAPENITIGNCTFNKNNISSNSNGTLTLEDGAIKIIGKP